MTMLTHARTIRSASLSVLAFAALGLCACDGAPSANPARSHAAGGALGPLGQGGDGGVQPASYGSQGQSEAPRASADRPAAADLDADAPRYHGKPMWAANRNHSSQENADYQFKKNGADLGAGSEDDFIAKAHAFVDHPPEGAETLKRANGDVLVYDAKSNVFAVVAKDGAPRTIFKPRDGAAYWAEQKTDLDKPYGGYKRSASKTSGGDDNG
jgi:hypothetical protein